MKNIQKILKITESKFDSVLSNHIKILSFHKGRNLTKSTYIRHIIEAINRIHHNNEVDSIALVKATLSRNNNISKKIAMYLAEEISHDEIIVKDLENFGLTKKEVENTELFFSTKLLIGYMKFSIEKDGYLPSIIWNWLVEWYSDKYNPKIVKAAGKIFGTKKIKGMKEHLKIDESLNHAEFLNQIIEIEYKEDKRKVENYIGDYIKLIEMYFIELLKDEK